MGDEQQRVVVGRIVGVFGVRGWVKIQSYTEPRENLLHYQPWWIAPPGSDADAACERVPLASRLGSKGLVVLLAGCTDPTTALPLVGCEIAVARAAFPAPDEGEYYWADLVGLRVTNLQGVDFGRVVRVMETGANDVLVIQGERERLVPYLPENVIQRVDLAAGQILVDWDPEF